MITKILVSLGISVCIFFGLALGLVLSERPAPLEPREGLDFSGVSEGGFTPPLDDPQFERGTYQGQDGAQMPATYVRAEGETNRPLVVMVHGSGWHGAQFEPLAWALRDVADVVAVTLRGHGATPERRGDVDYIGQFEDDLAGLMQTAKEAGRKVVLVGHSSGGGLVVRFAGGAHGALLDGAVLLAPFLKYNAAATRADSGGWAHALVRRTIGLAMLNTARITALNHLTSIQFNMPQEIVDGPKGHFATLAYSFRLNTSFAPRGDYLTDIAALPEFMLIAGAQDEAFYAEKYEPEMGAVTDKGRYVIVPEVGHLDIVDAPETEAAIREFLGGLD